jgi:hypothetical protein
MFVGALLVILLVDEELHPHVCRGFVGERNV